MFTISEHGSLAVAWNEQDKKSIERELRRLDPGFFLDLGTKDGPGVAWTVMQHIGSGRAPLTIVPEWRDPDGRPRPLSHALVHETSRREIRDREDAQRLDAKLVARRNLERREKARERSEAAYDEILRADLHRVGAGHGKPVTISTPLSERTG